MKCFCYSWKDAEYVFFYHLQFKFKYSKEIFGSVKKVEQVKL